MMLNRVPVRTSIKLCVHISDREGTDEWHLAVLAKTAGPSCTITPKLHSERYCQWIQTARRAVQQLLPLLQERRQHISQGNAILLAADTG